MKSLLLGGALAVALAGPALACRGTYEFPQIAEFLGVAAMTPAALAELRTSFEEARALHEQAHAVNDRAQMRVALAMLDEVKLVIE